jgi:hypothetical protein
MGNYRGRDSIVGIATRYGLEGPDIESRWQRNFPHLSRPALVSSLLYKEYRVFPGLKLPGRGVEHTDHLAPRLKND